ncbi:MAG: Mur ligase family protein [Planctomycetota bacterium]
MEVRDSRRVPGLSVIWDAPSAVLDVAIEAELVESLVRAWDAAARAILRALEWPEVLASRRHPGGVSLALAAPLDALLSATDVNEWACEQARASLEGAAAKSLAQALPELRRKIAREKRRHKGLLRVAAAAADHDVSLFTDDDCTSVGMGRHSLSFATAALPAVRSIDWPRVRDIPVALVTGTNGKSTSVRILGAMIAAGGLTPGMSTTDWVRVGADTLDHGDYAGSSGARMVLRDQRVDVAVLECARGGISRRGLSVRRARAALITNVAADHLGEWGVHDLEALTDVKFVVARALVPGGALVLNADDGMLVQRAASLGHENLVWFTREADHPLVRLHVARGGAAAVLDQGALWYLASREPRRLASIDELPFLFGGAALHNVSNALGAIATAFALDLDEQAVRRGLGSFSSDTEDNPGRLNEFDLGGVRALCDFAHNPHGMGALVAMIRALEAKRRLVILGQAGDRDDASIRELARLTLEARPERIVIKEMPEHLRGRPPGAVVGVIADELDRLGYPKSCVEIADDEMDAVRRSLLWARPGDVLLLLLHAQRNPVLQWLERVRQAGWKPGLPLPG